jgi:hypothetical protein
MAVTRLVSLLGESSFERLSNEVARCSQEFVELVDNMQTENAVKMPDGVVSRPVSRVLDILEMRVLVRLNFCGT